MPISFQYEKLTYPYIYVDENKRVFVTHPVSTAAVGDEISIALDNTCKTGKVCKEFYEKILPSIDDYVHDLKLDVDLLEYQHKQNSPAYKYKSDRLSQLLQYRKLMQTLRSSPYVTQMYQGFAQFPKGINSHLRSHNRTNVFGSHFCPRHEDSVLRVKYPLFTLNRETKQKNNARFFLGDVLRDIEILSIPNHQFAEPITMDTLTERALAKFHEAVLEEKLDNSEALVSLMGGCISRVLKDQYPHYSHHDTVAQELSKITVASLRNEGVWDDDFDSLGVVINNDVDLKDIATYIFLATGIDLRTFIEDENSTPSPFDKSNNVEEFSCMVQMLFFMVNVLYCETTHELVDFGTLIESRNPSNLPIFKAKLASALSSGINLEDYLIDSL